MKLLRDAEDIIKDAGGVPEEHQYDQRPELQVIVSSSVALQHEQNEQDKLEYQGCDSKGNAEQHLVTHDYHLLLHLRPSAYCQML